MNLATWSLILAALVVAPLSDAGENSGGVSVEVVIEERDGATLPTPSVEPSPTQTPAAPAPGEALPTTGFSFDALLWSVGGFAALAGGAALAVHARSRRLGRR